MDTIVGEVLRRLRPNDLLMVLSDHGFHSFRTAFSVNTWLVRNGYLVLKDQPDPATAFAPDENDVLRSVDWSQSKAYALGLGAIYLNIRGREGQGIVEPADTPALASEIRQKLLALTDPVNGQKVFTSVSDRGIFQGASEQSAPDLQLGYADGYQTNKVSAKGGIPAQVFEPNDDKWSGEHASSDPEETPGILFSNRSLRDTPAILDLGVTALRYLGLEAPPDYQGTDLRNNEDPR
jgi:predicted AlkP superfamily phosphohydrolase/phosphomutase